MNTRIQRLIGQSQAIPSVPQVVARLLEVAADPDYKRCDVVRAISSDAGAAADVLRLANSSLFGGVSKVASLDQAVGRLGLTRVRELVIVRSLASGLKVSTPIDRSYFWRRSLATGVLAARFAAALPGFSRDEALLAGLLADVGVAVLANAIPDEYSPIAAAYAPHGGGGLVCREREALTLTHAEVSAAALERWSLAETLVSAVRHHHDDALGEARESTPGQSAEFAGVLEAAGDLARLLCEAPTAAAVRDTCQLVTRRTELDPAAIPEMLGRVEPEIAELADLLRFPVIHSRVYSIIAATVSESLQQASA